LPWSSPAALPLSIVLLSPPALVLALLTRWALHRARSRLARHADAIHRGARLALAVSLGGLVFLFGVVVSNFALVDEPLERNTLIGCALSFALGLALTASLLRSARFRAAI